MFISIEDLLGHLLAYFKIAEGDFEKHKHFYNNAFDQYDNSIYTSILTRLVHLSNFSESGNWLNRRFDLYFEIVIQYQQVIELGFGIPYPQIHFHQEGKELKPNFIFIDKYKSSIQVSEEILNLLKQSVSFMLTDIEKTNFCEKAITDKRTLIVAIETIEHLQDDRLFWENIKRFQGNDILITLPIGPAIPSHHQVFKSPLKAEEYLSQHMIIKRNETHTPNQNTSGDSKDFSIEVYLGKIK